MKSCLCKYEMDRMGKKIIIGTMLVLTLLLLMPSSAALYSPSLTSHSTTSYTIINDPPECDPPQWFTIAYSMIIYSLQGRIILVTPLAITPSDDFWGDYDIKSYVFFFLLLTLVYRFAFWYTFLHQIAENNNWDLQ